MHTLRFQSKHGFCITTEKTRIYLKFAGVDLAYRGRQEQRNPLLHHHHHPHPTLQPSHAAYLKLWFTSRGPSKTHSRLAPRTSTDITQFICGRLDLSYNELPPISYRMYSSDIIATRTRDGWQRNPDAIPGTGHRFLFSPVHLDELWGPTAQWVRGLKRPGNKATYLPPLELRLKMRGIKFLLSPHAFITWCFIKSWGNFNFSTLPAVFCCFVAY